MGALLDLCTEREHRRSPTHRLTFDSPRAARLLGEEHRRTYHYVWSAKELADFVDACPETGNVIVEVEAF